MKKFTNCRMKPSSSRQHSKMDASEEAVIENLTSYRIKSSRLSALEIASKRVNRHGETHGLSDRAIRLASALRTGCKIANYQGE